LYWYLTSSIGVLYEHDQQHCQSNVYIQEIINDSDGNQLICCFTRQQAKNFLQLKFIQVDMTFKQIYGHITEIVFGYYSNDGQKCQFISH
jgi:hypothetical protein